MVDNEYEKWKKKFAKLSEHFAESWKKTFISLENKIQELKEFCIEELGTVLRSIIAVENAYVKDIFERYEDKEFDEEALRIILIVDFSQLEENKKDEDDLKTEIYEKISTLVEPLGVALSILSVKDIYMGLERKESDYLKIFIVGLIIYDYHFAKYLEFSGFHREGVVNRLKRYVVAHFLVLPNRPEIIGKGDVLKKPTRKIVERTVENVVTEDFGKDYGKTREMFYKNTKLCLLVDDSDLSYNRETETKDILEQLIMHEAERAREITDFDEQVSTRVFLLKDFWIGLKRGNPEIFELLNESLVTYDQGFVSYIKYLIDIGILEMNPRASDAMISDSREELLESVNKILEIIDSDICGSIFTSVAALLVRCGFFPPKLENMLEMVEEILEKGYEVVSEEFVEQLKFFIELRTKGASGYLRIENIPEILSKAFNFIGEIEEAYHILGQKKGVEEIEHLYSQILEMLEKFVFPNSKGTVSEVDIIKIFREKYIKTGKIKEYYLNQIKDILKFKQEVSYTARSVYEIESYRRKMYEVLEYLRGFFQREIFEKKKQATIKVLVGEAEYNIVSLEEYLILITQDKRNLLLTKDLKVVKELEPQEADEMIFRSQKQYFEITAEKMRALENLFENSNVKILF